MSKEISLAPSLRKVIFWRGKGGEAREHISASPSPRWCAKPSHPLCLGASHLTLPVPLPALTRPRCTCHHPRCDLKLSKPAWASPCISKIDLCLLPIPALSAAAQGQAQPRASPSVSKRLTVLEQGPLSPSVRRQAAAAAAASPEEEGWDEGGGAVQEHEIQPAAGAATAPAASHTSVQGGSQQQGAGAVVGTTSGFPAAPQSPTEGNFGGQQQQQIPVVQAPAVAEYPGDQPVCFYLCPCPLDQHTRMHKSVSGADDDD